MIMESEFLYFTLVSIFFWVLIFDVGSVIIVRIFWNCVEVGTKFVRRRTVRINRTLCERRALQPLTQVMAVTAWTPTVE